MHRVCIHFLDLWGICALRDALPFCHFSLKSNKPNKIPQNPKTIGEHFLKRRLELNLYQTDVAKLLGVDEMTIVNWEKGHTQPSLRCLPRIFEFLGYVPISGMYDSLLYVISLIDNHIEWSSIAVIIFMI